VLLVEAAVGQLSVGCLAGTNHAMWVTSFTVKGEDGYPLLRERLRELSRDELAELLAAPEIVEVSRDWAALPAELVYAQLIPHYKPAATARDGDDVLDRRRQSPLRESGPAPGSDQGLCPSPKRGTPPLDGR